MNGTEEKEINKIDEMENTENDVWNKGTITKKGFEILRKTLVPSNAKQEDIELFLYLSKRYDLDPFNREIFLIPFKNRITVTTSRDGYLKIAHRDPNFEGLVSMEVYEKDEFWIEETGKVHHRLSWASNDIKGAWATAFHKKRMPFTVFVRFDEYNKGTDIWVQYPAMMIKKVAEATVLRRQFDITIPNIDELNDVDDGKHTAKDFENYTTMQKHKEIIDAISVSSTMPITPTLPQKSITEKKPIKLDEITTDFIDGDKLDSNNAIITKLNSTIDSIINDFQEKFKKQPPTFKVILKQKIGSIETVNTIRTTTKTNMDMPNFLIEIIEIDGNVNISLTVIYDGNKGTVANKDIDIIISDILTYIDMFNNGFLTNQQKTETDKHEQKQSETITEKDKVKENTSENTTVNTNLITPKQVNYVKFMLTKLKKNKSEYGISNIESLTKSEAKELIDNLKKENEKS